MYRVETRDHTLINTLAGYDVPKCILGDSKFFSIILDFDEEESGDEDKDNSNFRRMNIMVNDIYFKKALEYYQHYQHYFEGNVEPDKEDDIQVVTRAMMHNTSVIAKRDAERKIKRRNDIPTEIFYIEYETERERQRIELLNEQSMLNLDEFTEKWMNDFERTFVEDFHWISPKSEEYPRETDGILNVNTGTEVKQKLSIKRMIDYCGFHMKEVEGERGYLQFQSLGRFLNQWVRTNMASKTWREMCEMCSIPYED